MTQQNFNSNDLLDNIQIVMVNTTLPANIGSAARAMHTMGLSKLTVVAPKLPIDETSISHAAGSQQILANCQVKDSLAAAVADSQLIFAASSRSRSMPRPVVTPMQAASIMADFVQHMQQSKVTESSLEQLMQDSKCQTNKDSAKISILFGREDRGLTNEELALASYHIQIDANPDYPVLNVASAVQVIASFIYAYVKQMPDVSEVAGHADKSVSITNKQLIHTVRQDWDEPAISQQQADTLNRRLTELMVNLDLADADDLRLLPQRISRLNARVQLDQKEYQLINAVIGKLNSRLLRNKND